MSDEYFGMSTIDQFGDKSDYPNDDISREFISSEFSFRDIKDYDTEGILNLMNQQEPPYWIDIEAVD